MAKKNTCSQPYNYKTGIVVVVWCGFFFFFFQGGLGSCFEKISVLIILRIHYILVYSLTSLFLLNLWTRHLSLCGCQRSLWSKALLHKFMTSIDLFFLQDAAAMHNYKQKVSNNLNWPLLQWCDLCLIGLWRTDSWFFIHRERSANALDSNEVYLQRVVWHWHLD